MAPGPTGGRRGGTLAGEVGFDVAQAVEILRQHLLVIHRDPERLLDERHQLDEAGRVEDVVLHEGGLIRDLHVAPHHDVVEQEPANDRLGVLHGTSLFLLATRVRSS
jgi:hypothetical protein